MSPNDTPRECAASEEGDAIKLTAAHARMEAGDHIGKIVLTLS